MLAPIANQRTIKDFSELVGVKIDCDERYEKMSSLLGMTESEKIDSIPKNRVVSARKATEDFFKKLDGEDLEYFATFAKIYSFIKDLAPARYDLSTLRSSPEFSKFENSIDRFGSCLPPRYSNIGSATGRLTVLEGPNVLTANPSFKSCLLSSHTGGAIFQMDAVSAEPKIAWLEAGNQPVKDVYQALAEEEFENQIDRGTAKKAVLCALYGQSASKLQEQLPISMRASDVIESTRRRLGYRSLLDRLMGEKKIRNGFGRPLRVSSTDQGPLIVSHYLQSTAAEACILAFEDFCTRFSGSCHPIYIIHDALIVDCDEQLAERLRVGSLLKLKGGSYPLHASVEICGRSKNEF